MLGSIFGKKTARKSTSRVRRNRFRPQCEVVEDRVVMTSLTGIASSALHIVAPVPPIIVPFSPQAQFVNLTTEPHDQVARILTAKTTQFYSFQLQEGDYLQTDLGVEPGPGAHVNAQMSILNANGAILDTSAPGTPYGFYCADQRDLLRRGQRHRYRPDSRRCVSTRSAPPGPRPGAAKRLHLGGNRVDVRLAQRRYARHHRPDRLRLRHHGQLERNHHRAIGSMDRSPPPTPPPGRWSCKPPPARWR